MDYVLDHWKLVTGILAAIILLLGYRWVLWLCGVIIVPDDSVGLMTKKFVLLGKNRRLPAGRIIALNNEAGYQADTLPPGLHLGLWPWQYQVDLVKFFTVPRARSAASRPVTASRCRADASWHSWCPAIPSRMLARSCRTRVNVGPKWG
jgi:hypothetical protein